MDLVKKFIKEWVIPLGVEVLVIFFLFKVVFMLVLVPTGSMLPTIQEKSILFCTYIHNHKNIQRGEILVFESEELDKVLIKRVIGLPGETVSVEEDGTVLIDGEKLDEPYVVYPSGGPELYFEIPDGHYLFFGDNRAGSQDARSWEESYIPEDKVIARARFTLWPASHFGGLK